MKIWAEEVSGSNNNDIYLDFLFRFIRSFSKSSTIYRHKKAALALTLQ